MKLGFLTGLKAEAGWLRGRYLVEVGGGTIAGAAAAVARLKGQGAEAIISFGLAGGLNPNLAPGTLIIPDVILDGTVRVPTDPDLVAWLGGGTGHVLTGAAGILATPSAKAALHALTGADAVDLESVAAARSFLPFAALRAIADPAARALPAAALIPLRADGGIDLPRILAAILRHPQDIPALIEVGRDTAKARATLTDTLRRVGHNPPPKAPPAPAGIGLYPTGTVG